MKDDFAKIMRENGMDETLQEVKAAHEYKDSAPRVNPNANSKADVGGFTPPSAEETGVTNRSLLKLVGVAVLVTALIVTLVMIGGR